MARWARSDVKDLRDEWPRITAVICVRNGGSTIAACLESLVRSDYPALEVIVCDDGSDDDTATIAGRFPFRVLTLPAGGLSRARNAGLAAATGEIVAYMDADASCHPHWPFFLVLSLEAEGVAATGGPNLPYPDAGLVERAVAASPGNPCEVLVSHDRAEHVPGCNMAFRRDALAAIGGFDPVYTAAGDDVDVCWKLLDRGEQIAFAAGAQVWHHRRGTVRGFLRQQAGYGRAEALLAARHPHRFNRLGQARWSGFVYGGVALLESLLRPVVYHGPMGTAPFQPVVSRRSEVAVAWVQARLPLAPAVAPLALLGVLSPWWLLVPAAVMLFVLAYAAAVAAGVSVPRHESRPVAFRSLVALLHVIQPLWRAAARTLGRQSPAPRREGFAWLGDRDAWLRELQRDMASARATVRCGGADARWDLDVRVGPLLRCRITAAVAWQWEPLLRVRLRPRIATVALALAALALLVAAPAPGAAGGAALALASAREAQRLRSVVRNAIARTTRDTEAAEAGDAGSATEIAARNGASREGLERVTFAGGGVPE